MIENQLPNIDELREQKKLVKILRADIKLKESELDVMRNEKEKYELTHSLKKRSLRKEVDKLRN